MKKLIRQALDAWKSYKDRPTSTEPPAGDEYDFGEAKMDPEEYQRRLNELRNKGTAQD